METSDQKSSIKYDPQEDDPRLKKRIDDAGKQAEEKLVEYPQRMGFCHRYWVEKKHILQDKYGIDW